MQQPIPQHRPSLVPQQQAVRNDFDCGPPERSDFADAGVQIAAVLVLITSKATVIILIGFGVRCIIDFGRAEASPCSVNLTMAHTCRQ
jgi:hypothetical protein